MGEITEKYRKLRQEVPENVKIVVATKTRTADEVEEVIEAGAKIIGENYAYPEAFNKYRLLGEKARKVRWHMIGPLQKNKINKALPLFDMIQTVDSVNKAKHINKRVPKSGKDEIPVLLEINSGREDSKAGFPPDMEIMGKSLKEIDKMEYLRIVGLMTMGPFTGDPEKARPYFKITRELFEKLKGMKTEESKMEILSMGMSNSYKVAISEGSNMIRVGSVIFGPR